MKKVFTLLLMIVFLLISLFYVIIFNNYFISCLLLMFNLFLAFFIVNIDNKVKSFINLQSIFLLGFFLFFLGRFPAFILDQSIYEDVFCIDFIFNYCENISNIIYLILVLNLILIFYSLAFIIKPKNYYKVIEDYRISKRKLLSIYIVTILSLLLVIINVIESIVLAVTQGYLSLYLSQAEPYQTPYLLLINTICVAGMAVIYSSKKDIKPMLFNIIFILFVFSMLGTILTGSRAAFISALLLLLWHFYKNKRINILRFLILLLVAFLMVYTLNTLAAVSGARPGEVNGSVFQIIADTLYGQGITLMVFNSSLHVEGYPILGYIKTLLPGIQILFPSFGVTERYEFDWSSYMTYHENRQAYISGNGLGWSIFSDFYVLSFGFLPIFCFYVYLFGRFTIYVSDGTSKFRLGLLFICILSFFSITRSSISPLILTIIIYSIFSLYARSLRLKKKVLL